MQIEKPNNSDQENHVSKVIFTRFFREEEPA